MSYSPEYFIELYRRIDNHEEWSEDELPTGVILFGDGFLEKLYRLAKQEKLDIYLTVCFNARMIECKEWFNGWSWDD